MSAFILLALTSCPAQKFRGKNTDKHLLLDPSHVLVIDRHGLSVHEFDPRATTPRCSTGDDCSIFFALPALHDGTDIQNLQCYLPGPRNFRDDCVLFREDPDLSVFAFHMSTSTSLGF